MDHIGQMVDKQCSINIPKRINSKKQNQCTVRRNSKIQNIITNTNPEVNNEKNIYLYITRWTCTTPAP
jgi:hypothetical protein